LKRLHIDDREIESVRGDGLEVTLLAASKDGTEIIKHCLDANTPWGVSAMEGWDALEYIHMLKGKMTMKDKNGDIQLIEGDYFYGNPVEDSALFIADEYTEFLYISSQPVFHMYSQVLEKLTDLAVSVEKIDGYTSDHCRRIMNLSMKVGQALELSYYELHLLNYSSFLHDLGKVNIPEQILNKPSKLTAEEWEIMKTHTTEGKNILYKYGNPVFNQIGDIIEQHHERYDGKGYPLSLYGENIDMKAAIISVVDSYDAMTSDRVYQQARSKEDAIEEIKRCSGIMYNPRVVDTFLSIINE
jgi:HD-GYP domain-containing protein (c-di-GMP phosphodiesterase class II)